MSDVKWIKICTDIFDDEKIILLETLPDSDSIIIIWFKLLCLAGKQNNKGVFLLGNIPYTEEMLATYFRRPVKTVKLALKAFENFRMIEIIDNVITIPTWEKHQALDQLENKKEYMRKYMKERREKQKKIIECKTNSKVNSETNVSSPDIELEKEINKEKIKTDKNRYKQLPLPQYLAYLLLNSGYDVLNQLTITDYGMLFDNWISSYGEIDVKVKLAYFINYQKNKTQTEKIKNKYLYFRESMNKNFKMVFDNESKEEIFTEEDVRKLLEELGDE